MVVVFEIYGRNQVLDYLFESFYLLDCAKMPGCLPNFANYYKFMILYSHLKIKTCS